MAMGSKSRETIYGASVRAAAERAAEARKQADRPPSRRGISACLPSRDRRSHRRRWAMRSMRGLAISESAPRCDTNQTVALDIVRRPKSTPVHELERYMRCKDCSQVRGYPYKRSHLVALRRTKISVRDPPSTWWPGER